jgi:hypothetical protein
MNRLELERLLSQRAEEIGESSLVHKCIYLANHIGERLSESDSWCGYHSVYEGEGLVIDVYAYAMGDVEVKVDAEKKRVFEVKQWVTKEPTSKNPTIVEEGHTYELIVYLDGPWRRMLEDTYGKLTTEVSEEELLAVKSRISI